MAPVPSERTLDAMARVPRHELVPVFWAMPTMLGLTDDAVEYHRGDVEGLEHLHDVDRAVAINKVSGATGGTTSTASAPRLLAAQADLLALEPGMSVLEIGTGPGYFAALISELVGEEGRVVSLDIDADVAGAAAERLRALGYANVTTIARDGDEGAVEHAPFDRIVGSVGCNDVAAAWIAQLAPDGFALVPLSHGAVHPMVRVDARGEGAIATRSGYVRIQGRQDDVALWPHAVRVRDAHREGAAPRRDRRRARDRGGPRADRRTRRVEPRLLGRGRRPAGGPPRRT